MKNLSIKVEGLSKQYQLGKVGTGTLRNDLNRLWHAVRGKEDPFIKIGQVNDRTRKAESDFVWALQDINFEVKQGEVLGIIGRNGAGKSTLLKILSKITAPTTGEISVNGRIASLLEVGTGFHPELSGRENIFLNGAILGMKKWEIQKKFDEIVDFSGVEAYIDTPVKRYSSGMYVRLAFAVAAFLEPEVLIVDEVLAVGDADFQKKCLGRMQDVSRNEGRTVLFVSHNIASIQALCTSGLLLNNGEVSISGGIDDVINMYTNKKVVIDKKITSRYINKISLLNVNYESENTFFIGDTMIVRLEVLNSNELDNAHVGFFINDKYGVRVATCSTLFRPVSNNNTDIGSTYEFKINNLPFLEGLYSIDIVIAYKIGGRIEFIESAISFEISSSNLNINGVKMDNYFGYVFLETDIKIF